MVQFNEGDSYGNYQNAFTKNGKYPGSSIQEIFNLNISQANLAIEKPIVSNLGTVNEGYVAPTTLGSWGCKANTDFGWNGGFTAWQWNQQDEYPILNWRSE